MHVWCERSIHSFSLVVNLPVNRANPTGRSNAKSWDGVRRLFVTLENLNDLSSVEYDRCDQINNLNQLSTT